MAQPDPILDRLRRVRRVMQKLAAVRQDHPKYVEARGALQQAREVHEQLRGELETTLGEQTQAEAEELAATSPDLGAFAAGRLGIAAGSPAVAGTAIGGFLGGPVGALAGGAAGFGLGMIGVEPLAQIKEALTPGGASAADVSEQIAATTEAHPLAFHGAAAGTTAAGLGAASLLQRLQGKAAKEALETTATQSLIRSRTASAAANEAKAATEEVRLGFAQQKLAMQQASAAARTQIQQAQQAARTAQNAVNTAFREHQMFLAQARIAQGEGRLALLQRAEQAAAQMRAAQIESTKALTQLREAQTAFTQARTAALTGEAAEQAVTPLATGTRVAPEAVAKVVVEAEKVPAELAARIRYFRTQGFSASDAQAMAHQGTQVPRAFLERALGRRLPGKTKWL